MLSGMSVSTPESSKVTQGTGPFHKVGENLYRLKTTGTYYALFKRGGKQIRKSLKTTDKKLAKRRLSTQREKVSRLNTDKDTRHITFAELSDRWMNIQRTKLKASSATRFEACIKNLAPFFKRKTFRNIDRRQCEEWLINRGQKISASSYKQERRVLIVLFKYAISLGIVLDNVAGSMSKCRA